jgi:hypothetical protein
VEYASQGTLFDSFSQDLPDVLTGHTPPRRNFGLYSSRFRYIPSISFQQKASRPHDQAKPANTAEDRLPARKGPPSAPGSRPGQALATSFFMPGEVGFFTPPHRLPNRNPPRLTGCFRMDTDQVTEKRPQTI